MENQAEYQAKVEEIAQSIASRLSDVSKIMLRENPSLEEQYFVLGETVRNEYIFTDGFFATPGLPSIGQVTNDVVREVFKCVLPEYAPYPLVFDYLQGSILEMHRYSTSVKQCGFQQALANAYSVLENLDGLDQAKQQVQLTNATMQNFCLQLAEGLWCFNEAQEKEIPAEYIEEYQGQVRKTLQQQGIFIPSDMLAFLDCSATQAEKQQAMNALQWYLKATHNQAVNYLPACLKENTECALYLVQQSGAFLEFLPALQANEEVVMQAVRQNAAALNFADTQLQNKPELLRLAAQAAYDGMAFYGGVLASYAGDEELVSLAIQANGNNLVYAAACLQAKKPLALQAVLHAQQGFSSRLYDCLPEKLQQDRDIVFAVAQWDFTPMNFPPAEFRDNEELANIMAQGANKACNFINMSDRLKERYLSDEDAFRWNRR